MTSMMMAAMIIQLLAMVVVGWGQKTSTSFWKGVVLISKSQKQLKLSSTAAEDCKSDGAFLLLTPYTPPFNLAYMLSVVAAP